MKTSQIKKILKSKSGIKHEWWGYGWYDFEKDIIIVGNGFEAKKIKREDFLKCETIKDLIKYEIKQEKEKK